MSDTLAIDAYRLTTLCAHADAGRLGQRVGMAFFFRDLPPRRNYVVFCGLRQVLEHAAAMRLDAEDLALLDRHALPGPALVARPRVRRIEAARARVAVGLAALPAHLRALDTDHGRPWPLVVSDALAARLEACVEEIVR